MVWGGEGRDEKGDEGTDGSLRIFRAVKLFHKTLKGVHMTVWICQNPNDCTTKE